MSKRCRNCFRDDQALNDERRCGRCVAEMIHMRMRARLPEIIDEVFDAIERKRWWAEQPMTSPPQKRPAKEG